MRPMRWLTLLSLLFALVRWEGAAAAEQARSKSREVERREAESSRKAENNTDRNRRDAAAHEARATEASAKRNSRETTAGAAESTTKTSRAARRESMRDAGIPTSQQPVSQSRNASGREYSYDVAARKGGTRRKSVQEQTKDRSHPGESHWEAGQVKIDRGYEKSEVRKNQYGRPKLESGKAKAEM